MCPNGKKKKIPKITYCDIIIIIIINFTDCILHFLVQIELIQYCVLNNEREKEREREREREGVEEGEKEREEKVIKDRKEEKEI